MSDRTYFYDGPPMRDVRPPTGVASPVTGVRCRFHPFTHPNEVLTAATDRALERASARWRCPTCSASAWGEVRSNLPTRRLVPAETTRTA